MNSLEEQYESLFNQVNDPENLMEWDNWNDYLLDTEINVVQPSKELLDRVIQGWSERVRLLGFKRKRGNGFNTKQYIAAQQEYFVGAMVVLQQFYPKANFEGWAMIIQTGRDMLDFA